MACHLAGLIKSSSHESKQPVTLYSTSDRKSIALTAVERCYLSLMCFRQKLLSSAAAALIDKNTQVLYGPCFTVGALNLFVSLCLHASVFSGLEVGDIFLKHWGELHLANQLEIAMNVSPMLLLWMENKNMNSYSLYSQELKIFYNFDSQSNNSILLYHHFELIFYHFNLYLMLLY